MKPAFLILLALVVTAGLSGCGQKGPLRLPPQDTSQTQPANDQPAPTEQEQQQQENATQPDQQTPAEGDSDN